MSKRPSSPVIIQNETQSKKIKIEQPQTNQTFADIQQIVNNQSFKQVKELINESMYPVSLESFNQAKQKLKAFSIKELLCGILFRNKDDEVFSFSFGRCAQELKKKTQCYSTFSDFLIQEYDYENSYEDFPLEQFFKDVIHGTYSSCLFRIFGKEQKQELKEALFELIDLWMQGDEESLLLFYTNYFRNFVYMFADLGIEESEEVNEMHDMCIIGIMRRIHYVSIGLVDQKFEIFQDIEFFDTHDHLDSHSEFIDPNFEENNTIIEGLGKTKNEIHTEVQDWRGSYPFSGLLIGNFGFEQFSKILKQFEIQTK